MSEAEISSSTLLVRKLSRFEGKVQSAWLVVVIFFLYKSCESLLQPSIRLDIYNIICSLVLNTTSFNQCGHKTNLLYSNNPTRVDSYGNSELQTLAPEELADYEENLVQHSATKWLLAYRIILNLPALVLCLFCASWTDKWGRIPFMVLPSMGAVIAVLIFSITLHPAIQISHVALGMILAGAGIYSSFGKSAFMTIACNSYVVDCTTDQERTRYLGRLLGFNFLGLFVGSLMVGISQSSFNLDSVLIVVAIVNAIILGLELFIIKDTFKSETEDDTSSNKAKEPCCALEKSVLTLFRKRLDSNRSDIIILMAVLFVGQIAKAGEQDVILLYVKHRPLSWEHSTYGYYLAVYYGCMGFNLTILMPLIEKYCQLNDRTLVSIGLAMKAARLLVTALCRNTIVIFGAAVFGSTAGFIVSGCRSILSKMIDQSETGRLFSMLSCLDALSNLIGPSLFCGLYDLTVDIYPGTTLVIDVVIHAVSLAFILLLPKKPGYKELD